MQLYFKITYTKCCAFDNKFFFFFLERYIFRRFRKYATLYVNVSFWTRAGSFLIERHHSRYLKYDGCKFASIVIKKKKRIIIEVSSQDVVRARLFQETKMASFSATKRLRRIGSENRILIASLLVTMRFSIYPVIPFQAERHHCFSGNVILPPWKPVWAFAASEYVLLFPRTLALRDKRIFAEDGLPIIVLVLQRFPPEKLSAQVSQYTSSFSYSSPVVCPGNGNCVSSLRFTLTFSARHKRKQATEPLRRESQFKGNMRKTKRAAAAINALGKAAVCAHGPSFLLLSYVVRPEETVTTSPGTLTQHEGNLYELKDYPIFP